MNGFVLCNFHRFLCCDGFEIRRNLRCGFPNPQVRKGFLKTQTRVIYLKRYIFADYKSLYSMAWDYKSHAAEAGMPHPLY